MKPLLWKELREQRPLAVAAMVGLGLVLALAFDASRNAARNVALSNGYGGGENLQPLLSMVLLTSVAAGCGLFAVVLGFLQIRAEKHPDLWAFLIHRPVEPDAVLRSKLVAGWILYGVGAGLPVFVTIVVASLPGQVAAPFAWPMALPLLAVFLLGFVFHAAGMLTGLRQARWYASRIAGLGPPIAATPLALSVPEFWQAALIIGVAGLVVTLATWGSFRTRGWYRGQPVAGRLGLVAVTAVTGLLALGLGLTLVLNLVRAQRAYEYSYYGVTRSGEVVRVHQRESSDELDLTDLQGRPLVDPGTGAKWDRKLWQSRIAPGHSARVRLPQAAGDLRWRPGYASTFRFFAPWRVESKTLWYLTGDGRLLGFDGVRRRLVGEVLPSGAKGGPGDATASGFFWVAPGYGGSFQPADRPEVLADRRHVYSIDLSAHTAEPVLSADTGDGIVAASKLPTWAMVIGETNPVYLVVSERRIRLVRPEGTTVLDVPYALSPREYPHLTVHVLEVPGSYLIRQDPDAEANQRAGGRLLSRVRWVRADGTVERSLELPKLPDVVQDRTLETCLVSLAPPLVTVTINRDERPVGGGWPWLVSSVCAAAAGWQLRRRRSRLPALVGWLGFVLMAGPAGWLAFVAVQEWPARERCPACGRPRAIDRERCEHCNAPTAPPERNGLEIFEPLAAP